MKRNISETEHSTRKLCTAVRGRVGIRGVAGRRRATRVRQPTTAGRGERTGHDTGGGADGVPCVVAHGDAAEEHGEGAGAADGGGADVRGHGDSRHEDDLAVGVVVCLVEEVCTSSGARG